MVSGIVGWGVYLPFWRLERASIGAAFGTARGRGSRSVASFDEDTTTLGVEAGRRCLELAGTVRPSEIVFATPDPAYLDKTNATTVHAALGLDPEASAYDACGSVRSAWGALRSAADRSRSTRTRRAVRSPHRPGWWIRREPGRGRCLRLPVRSGRRGRRAARSRIGDGRSHRAVEGSR